jgi:hypothetical protein
MRALSDGPLYIVTYCPFTWVLLPTAHTKATIEVTQGQLAGIHPLGWLSRGRRSAAGLEYPFHDRTITVTCCGRICIGRRKINLSIVFAGQNVGVKEVSDKVWLVSFMQYDLGFFDHETGRITSAENPFGAKVLPMCPA